MVDKVNHVNPYDPGRRRFMIIITKAKMAAVKTCWKQVTDDCTEIRRHYLKIAISNVDSILDMKRCHAPIKCYYIIILSNCMILSVQFDIQHSFWIFTVAVIC